MALFLQRSGSVAEVEVPESHDEKGRPVKKGIDDPRMGTNDRALRCQVMYPLPEGA